MHLLLDGPDATEMTFAPTHAKPHHMPEGSHVPPFIASKRHKVDIDSSHRLVVITDPRSPGADRFRYLRMRLRELKASQDLKTLVITSPIPEDGKSTVALNLATVLAAENRHRVLLIEADLHRPVLAERLGIPSQPGLAECVENACDPLLAITQLDPLNWFFLQAGTPAANPTEIIQSDVTTEVMNLLRAHFDWILIDTPPVAAISDALVLSKLADASLLVVRAGHTPQTAVEEAISLLEPNRVAGLILNASAGLNRLYAKYAGYYRKK